MLRFFFLIKTIYEGCFIWNRRS